MIIWRLWVQSLVAFNFCALNQPTANRVRADQFQSSDSARVLVRTSLTPFRAESEWNAQTPHGVQALYIGVCQIGTSQSTRTDSDSAKISSDSIGLRGILHRNGVEYVRESKDLGCGAPHVEANEPDHDHSSFTHLLLSFLSVAVLSSSTLCYWCLSFTFSVGVGATSPTVSHIGVYNPPHPQSTVFTFTSLSWHKCHVTSCRTHLHAGVFNGPTYDRSYLPSHSLSPFQLQPHGSHMHSRVRCSRPHSFVRWRECHVTSHPSYLHSGVDNGLHLDRSYSLSPSLSPFWLQLTYTCMHDANAHAFVCVRSFTFRSFVFHLPRHHCHTVARISHFKVTWLKGWGTWFRLFVDAGLCLFILFYGLYSVLSHFIAALLFPSFPSLLIVEAVMPPVALLDAEC